MRRFISLFLTIMMVLTVVPISFAQEGSDSKMSLESAIELAKSKLTIPEKDFNFNSNYTENNDGKNLWFLNWNSKAESSKYFDASVTINADTKDIVSYSSYTENKSTSKIPKYTKEQATKAAEEFITNINAEKFKQTKLYEKKYSNGGYANDTYFFSYVRYLEDIPYVDNFINVFVDKRTLNITSFQLEWDDKPVCVEQSKVTLEQAKEIFKNKLGLELSYKLVAPNGDYRNQKAMLVYSLKYGNKPINAQNGEILKDGYFFIDGYGYTRASSVKEDKNQKSFLTPEEQKAVDKTKKYMAKEKAAEIAKKYLKLEDGYILTNSNLSDDYLGLQNAVWNFYWEYKAPQNNKAKAASDRYGSQSCSVDAETGEIRNFYIWDSKFEAPKDVKMKYNKESAKSLANAYIKKIMPQKSKDFEFRDYDLYNQSYDNSVQKYFYFNYIRKQGDVYCPFNKINITVDAYSGMITNFSFDWYNIALPVPERIITLDEAYQKLFNELNLSLKIKKVDGKNFDSLSDKIIPVSNTMVPVLVYYLDNIDEVVSIDAEKGVFIGYSGEELKQKKPITFSDIQDLPGKTKIETLAELGIIESDSDKFMPGEKIKQKDLIKMLVKSNNAYSKPEGYDGYYTEAFKNGILLEQGEKTPEAAVTKLQLAKYFVRMLNLKNIAQIGGIYKVGFSDASTILEADVGYCAIANGLKIIDTRNNAFEPKGEITRAEAAGYIYNYLNVER